MILKNVVMVDDGKRGLIGKEDSVPKQICSGQEGRGSNMAVTLG